MHRSTDKQCANGQTAINVGIMCFAHLPLAHSYSRDLPFIAPSFIQVFNKEKQMSSTDMTHINCMFRVPVIRLKIFCLQQMLF